MTSALSPLFGELCLALRSLRRRPAFALVVIGTVALGIGATTTMLSVVNAAILRPLPFRDADHLVQAQGFVKREQDPRGLSYLEAMDWRAMSTVLDGLAAFNAISLNITDRGREPMRAVSEIVSADYFRILGASPVRGRTFLPEEERTPDTHPVAVIGYGLWQSRFGGTEDVVGRTVAINDRPFTIVGVMPPDFRGLTFQSDVWIPMMMVSAIRPPSILERRAQRWLTAVARLKPGVTIEEAQRDLDRVATSLESAYPETNRDRGARVLAPRDWYLGNTRPLLIALFGAVGFLLLIACANVMNLQLVRAAARRREMALRIALGAGRRRLVRHLLIEGLVIAALGATVGVLLAAWGVDVLVPLAPAGLLPPYVEVSIDLTVLGYAALVTAAAGIAFGVAPALTRSRTNLVHVLKEGAPAAAGGFGSLRRLPAQQLFVVAEVALALVLLAGATLMVQSLRRQLRVDPGFRAEHVLAARLTLPLDRYPDSSRTQFVAQLVERMRAIPGVSAAAVGADLPFRGNESGGYLTWDGGPPDGVNYARHRVTPEFFATLGIRLVRGRAFTWNDDANAPQVAIVSASMAKRLWPDRDAIGERLHVAAASGTLPPLEVVGIVDDVRYRNLTTDLLAPLGTVDVYLPFAQWTDETIDLALRSETPPSALVPALRQVVAQLDAALPLYQVAPLAHALDQQTVPARFGSLMLSLFAFMAMLLAAVGLYGLLAFLVGTSGREIAIRMALGAGSGSVVGAVIRKGMLLAGAGAVIGLLIAVPTTRVLTDLLFGVRATDPATLIGVTALLLVTAFMACWIPARRASRVDPQAAFKTE